MGEARFVVEALEEMPGYMTAAAFSRLRKISVGRVQYLIKKNRLDHVVIGRGRRIIHKDASWIESVRPTKTVDGVPVRRCPSCCEWKMKEGYHETRWRGGSGGRCRSCVVVRQAFDRASTRDPVLKKAYELSGARDREILVSREDGVSSPPPESRILELIAWAEREGLRGDE